MPAALVGLDATFIALFFVLVLLVMRQFIVSLLVSVLGSAPYVGPWLAGNIASAAAAFDRVIAPAANAALGAFTVSLNWLDQASNGVEWAVRAAAWFTYTALVKLRDVTVPHLISLAASSVSALAYDLYRQAYGFAVGVQTQAIALFHAAESFAGVLYGQALAYADQAAGRVGIASHLEIERARSEAAALTAAEAAARVQALQTAEGYADSLFSQAVGVSAAAEAALRNDLGAEAQALGRTISAGLAGVRSDLNSQTAAGSAAAAGALALVVARVRAIEDSPCMRQCEPLGGLGAGLASLDMLAVFGLVAAMEADPRGAAAAVEGFLGPIIGTVEAGAAALGAPVK